MDTHLSLQMIQITLSSNHALLSPSNLKQGTTQTQNYYKIYLYTSLNYHSSPPLKYKYHFNISTQYYYGDTLNSTLDKIQGTLLCSQIQTHRTHTEQEQPNSIF